MVRILIVDDEKSIRRTLAEFLRNDGYEVREAEDADTALQRLQESEFDVVVTDIILPRVSGVELLQRIRGTAPHVQVVMMTGEPTVDTARESLRAGAADYLFKPINKEAILRVVAAAAHLKALEDTKRRLEVENRAHKENLEWLVDERTRQLRASEEKARELSHFNQGVLDALTAHICVLAEDGTILAVNRGWEDFKTANPPLAAGAGVGANYLAVCEAATGGEEEMAREAVRGLRAVARGTLPEFSLEYPCHSPDAKRWFFLRATRFADGGPARVVVAHADITARKEAEEELSRERRLLRTLVDHLPLDVYVKDAAARKILANPVDLRTLGAASEAEVLGKTDFDFYPPEQAAAFFADDQQVLQQGQPVFNREERFTRPDGTEVWYLTSKVPLCDAAGHVTGLAGFGLDITARKEAEARLREQANMLDLAQDGIVVRDLEGRVRYWNKASERIVGWTAEEVLGLSMNEVLRLEDGFVEAIFQTLLEKGEWSGEVEVTAKDGRLVTVQSRCTLVRDTQGQPKSVLVISTDITEKKQLEAQFLRAQRLEGVGALASGIAHDLNNILAPILMIAPLMRESNPDAESREMLDTVESCARRGADIIKQLLTFARGKPGVRIPLPMRHLLRDMNQIIRETFPRDIRPSVEMPKALWPVLGDATQFHQALMNLCVNARDAMPDGGTLTIGAKSVTVDEAFAAKAPGARPGPYVCVSVADTGSGIPPENLDHIFDPFFTTKEIGKGTGLGLPTVLGIVRGHEGFLQVDSRPGHGTSFDLYFPASPDDLKPEIPKLKLAAPPRGQGELILVVDDEAAVRDSVRRTLETHGYRVASAAHGAEGLEVFTRHRAAVRAVLTDMMMPVMNGPAMIAALRAQEPRLSILGMTGLADRKSVKGFEDLELSELLTKPFSGDELLRALHAILHAPGAAASSKGAG